MSLTPPSPTQKGKGGGTCIKTKFLPVTFYELALLHGGPYHQISSGTQKTPTVPYVCVDI